MVTVDQIDVRKLYYAAKQAYGLGSRSDDNATMEALCSIDPGAPCQAVKKMAGFPYTNVGVDPKWYPALGISTTPAPAPYVPPVQTQPPVAQPPVSPPAAACPEGTTRQVKCPKNNKMVTQKCVNGLWVTQDAKGCVTDQERILGTAIGVIVLVVIIYLLLRR